MWLQLSFKATTSIPQITSSEICIDWFTRTWRQCGSVLHSIKNKTKQKKIDDLCSNYFVY